MMTLKIIGDVEGGESYKLSKIGDLCNVVTGGTPSTQCPEYYGGKINWLKSGDIKGKYVFETPEKLTQAGVENSNAKVHPAGGVAIALSGRGQTRGRTVVIKKPMACSQSVAIMLPNESLDSDYLHYSLSNKYSEIRDLTGDNDRSGLNLKLVSNIQIPLPPLPTQHHIATILSTVDDAIQRSQQAIAKTERLKAGVMQELMTKGIGHTEFKEDPDIGRVPKEWEVVTLGDICLSNAFGPRFSASLYNPQGNVAVLRTTDLDQNGNISYDKMPRAKLDLNEFKEHILLSNDLVITRSGTCGIGAIFSEYKIPVLPGAFLIRFRLSQEINAQFLKQYINSSFGREEITKLECGGVQKNLKGSALLKIKIPRPSPIEQERIISVLSTIDSKLTLQRKRTSHLEQLKQGLMSNLLTGKRRVKVT